MAQDSVLTADSFMKIKIHEITKVKVKADSHIAGTRMLKICTSKNEEFFFCVRKEEQADWMMKIVWAKLNSMGVRTKIAHHFRGKIES